MAGLGTDGWRALVLTVVNTAWLLLGVVLTGLRSPVGKASEAPPWGPGHTPPSCLARLLPWSPGDWGPAAAPVTGEPGSLENPGSHFTCLYAMLGAGNTQGPPGLSPGKDARIPLP